jgi:hypothetical protein
MYEIKPEDLYEIKPEDLIDHDNWVVSVHSGEGSMAEAVDAMATVGPYDKITAVNVANEINRQLQAGPISNLEMWATLQPLTTVDPGINPVQVANVVLSDEAFDFAMGRD